MGTTLDANASIVDEVTAEVAVLPLHSNCQTICRTEHGRKGDIDVKAYLQFGHQWTCFGGQQHYGANWEKAGCCYSRQRMPSHRIQGWLA